MSETKPESCISEKPVGLDERGKFAPGNKLGKRGGGSIDAANSLRLKRILGKVCTDERLENMAVKLIKEAEKGEPWAIHEVIDRLCGKPKAETDLNVNNTICVADMSEDELRRMAGALKGIAVQAIEETQAEG